MGRVLELPPPLPQPRPCSPCGRVDLAAPEISKGELETCLSRLRLSRQCGLNFLSLQLTIGILKVIKVNGFAYAYSD